MRLCVYMMRCSQNLDYSSLDFFETNVYELDFKLPWQHCFSPCCHRHSQCCRKVYNPSTNKALIPVIRHRFNPYLARLLLHSAPTLIHVSSLEFVRCIIIIEGKFRQLFRIRVICILQVIYCVIYIGSKIRLKQRFTERAKKD